MAVKIIVGDVRKTILGISDRSVHCVVTSPPYYGLRDYGHDAQIGAEDSPEAFTQSLVDVFRECRRVLRDDGTLWLNLGDSYANDGKWGRSSGGKHAKGLHGNTGVGRNKKSTGLKPKDLIGIPWRVAFALQADGWWLRQDIIWAKPNPMPESVTDRCTKAHEYLFLLSKSERYYFDKESISTPQSEVSIARRRRGDWRTKDGWADAYHGNPPKGLAAQSSRPESNSNKRSVWTVATQPFKGAHFATFPTALIEPCILAGCPKDGTVFDPFGGAGTTGLVASRLGRSAVLCELNPEYAEMAAERISSESPIFNDVTVCAQGEDR